MKKTSYVGLSISFLTSFFSFPSFSSYQELKDLIHCVQERKTGNAIGCEQRLSEEQAELHSNIKQAKKDIQTKLKLLSGMTSIDEYGRPIGNVDEKNLKIFYDISKDLAQVSAALEAHKVQHNVSSIFYEKAKADKIFFGFSDVILSLINAMEQTVTGEEISTYPVNVPPQGVQPGHQSPLFKIGYDQALNYNRGLEHFLPNRDQMSMTYPLIVFLVSELSKKPYISFSYIDKLHPDLKPVIMKKMESVFGLNFNPVKIKEETNTWIKTFFERENDVLTRAWWADKVVKKSAKALKKINVADDIARHEATQKLRKKQKKQEEIEQEKTFFYQIKSLLDDLMIVVSQKGHVS